MAPLLVDNVIGGDTTIACGRGYSRTYAFGIYVRPSASSSNTWGKGFDNVGFGSTTDIEYYDVVNVKDKLKTVYL